MRKCLVVTVGIGALLLLFAVASANAEAPAYQAGEVPDAALAALGLGGMQRVSDAAGEQIRGQGFPSWVQSFLPSLPSFPSFPSFPSLPSTSSQSPFSGQFFGNPQNIPSLGSPPAPTFPTQPQFPLPNWWRAGQPSLLPLSLPRLSSWPSWSL